MIPIAPIFIRSKEVLEKLSALLDEERSAYGEVDSDTIINIAEQKQSLLDEMNQLNECEELLQHCKTKNNTNARILNTLQKRNKHLFELLQGHSSKNKVYTARGSTHPISSKHTLGRA